MKKYIVILFCAFILHCAVSNGSHIDLGHGSSDDDSPLSNFTQGAGGSFSLPEFRPSIDGNFGGAGTCYSDEIQSKSADLNMVILFDRSGSMIGRWEKAVNSLLKFLKDKKSIGISVALSYFPDSPGADECAKEKYEKPRVDFGMLPNHFKNLETSLLSEDASGSSTPLYGAMVGTYGWLIPYTKNHPSEKTAVVIVSDGSPNGCGGKNKASHLGNLAYEALQDEILTVTIGIGAADLIVLDEIALGGGTGEAIDITGSTSLLYDKLSQISSAFQCEYKFEDNNFDPDQWYVNYISSNGFPDWLIPRVTNKLDCDNQHGWYYDNNDYPSKLTLCDESCNIVTFDENFVLQLAFGCSGDEEILK